MELSGFLNLLTYRRRLAIKVHFGEDGNDNFLNPKFVREAVRVLSLKGVQPTIVETATLYRGKRQEAKTHIELAHDHGFRLQDVLAPIEILDGKNGAEYYEVETGLKYVRKAKLAKGLRRYGFLLNLAHFKGHFVTGFGGVVKNLAMGLSAKGGKLEMHSSSKPFVNSEKCASCDDCIDYCPAQAISFVEYVAKIGYPCTGCAGCITVCRYGAIQIKWDSGAESVQKKMAEYALAILRERRALHFNFLINITPNCDCYPTTEKPILADIGFLASLDPIACEQASWDKTKKELKKLYSHLNPEILLEYGEKIGLGNREYKLVEL